MHSASALTATVVVAVTAIALMPTAEATGCGEPTTNPNGCSDWQCSRFLPPIAGGEAEDGHCVRGRDKGLPCLVNSDCYHGLQCNASKECDTAESSKVAWKGYVSIVGAIACFGSNFIPVKNVVAGNGVFFQFCMACGVLFVGIIVQLCRGTFYFYSYAMLGGMFWTLGNACSVPVIQMIGMGLGVSIWGVTNMSVGWACGTFGIWGVEEEHVKISWLSYLGLALGILAIIGFALVKPSAKRRRRSIEALLPSHDEFAHVVKRDPLLNAPRVDDETGDVIDDEADTTDVAKVLGKTCARVLGVILALVAGLLYGFNLIPVQAMMDQYKEKSKVEDLKYSPDGLDYAMSQFIGIFLSALCLNAIFLGLNMVHEFPSVFPKANFRQVALPAMLCGAVWATGQVCWFIANTNLGLVVSFPMIGVGPGFVACLWGVALFREIHGVRNFSTMGVAFFLLLASCMCTVFAKQGV